MLRTVVQEVLVRLVDDEPRVVPPAERQDLALQGQGADGAGRVSRSGEEDQADLALPLLEQRLEVLWWCGGRCTSKHEKNDGYKR